MITCVSTLCVVIGCRPIVRVVTDTAPDGLLATTPYLLTSNNLLEQPQQITSDPNCVQASLPLTTHFLKSQTKMETVLYNIEC